MKRLMILVTLLLMGCASAQVRTVPEDNKDAEFVVAASTLVILWIIFDE